MIEKKFRAFDKFQDKHIFVGFHVVGEVTVFGGIYCTIGETRKERFEKFGHKSSIETWDDFIIEQFSGLKDSAGVDIYENDIVYIAGFGDYVVEFPFIELYEALQENDIVKIKGYANHLTYRSNYITKY